MPSLVLAVTFRFLLYSFAVKSRLAEVAQKVGVSEAMVSRVLDGRPAGPEGTRNAALPHASERLFGTAATAAACAGFVLLGAVNAFFGPAIPALRDRFGLAPAGAGLAISTFFLGAVSGVLVAGIAHRRAGNVRLLIASFQVMGRGGRRRRRACSGRPSGAAA